MSLLLQPSRRVDPAPGPLLLAVLDGVGYGRGDAGDAVALARTPTLDALLARCPNRSLRAHGTAVGLPSDKDMGNSEVGHNALGAGRVYDQGSKLVERALADGSLFAGSVWRRCMELCAAGGALHLIGLLSDGNVHSHEKHLHALLVRAAEDGAQRVYVHPLLDGRDVPATSALTYVERLEEQLTELRAGGARDFRIASGGGRMLTTMDRYEADWSIVERGWKAHVHGEARQFASATEAIEAFRGDEPGIGDQFLPAFVVAEGGRPVGAMADGDAVVLFNFRGDRAIEISHAFDRDDSFEAFDRGAKPDLFYAGMMLYDGDLHIPGNYLVAPPAVERTLGERLAATGVPQYALSETQKYGHVTYFWNGNRGEPFDKKLEIWREIPSDIIPFEQRPWMKAAEIADEAIAALKSGRHRFLRLNFANGDMVGHTGHLDATVIAVEAVDLCLARLAPVVEALSGTLVVTADHGNADEMHELDKKGHPKRDGDGFKVRTSHTLNPVPFVIRRGGTPLELRSDLPDAGLGNVAATVAELLGYQAPGDMDPSLLA